MKQDNDSFVDFIISDRRDALHLAPIIHELRRDTGLFPRVTMVANDNDNLTGVLASLDISPDMQWRVRGSENSPSLFQAEVLLLLVEFWNHRKPKWLMSFGHSEFSFSCLFSAFQNEIQIAHILDVNESVESDSPERTAIHKKRVINTISTLLFTPNNYCKNLLLADGIEERRIYSVGSSLLESGKIISSSNVFASKFKSLATDSAQLANIFSNDFVLVELNTSAQNHERIMDDVRRLILDHPLQKFVLLNPGVHQKVAFAEIFCPYNLVTVDRVNHFERCFLYANATFVLSDSVEVLEECASFGTRGILLKNNSVRVDLVSTGWVTLANQANEGLEKRFQTLLSEGKEFQTQTPLRMSESSSTGASRRIVAALTSRTN